MPGPGHSSADRSLSVRVKADGSFIVHSFADDDWRECRDYINRALGGALKANKRTSTRSPIVEGNVLTLDKA